MKMPLLKKLQIENKILRENLNSIVPSVTGEGEDVVLENTANAKFKKFKIKGNSKQEGEPSIEVLVENKSCGDDINLFDGVFEIGFLNSSTGNVEHLYDDHTIYAPQYIEISSTKKCYIRLFDTLCVVSRIVEYDSNKNFIKCSYSKVQNYEFNLQKNTKYIRFACDFGEENKENLTTNIKAKVTQNTEINSYSSYGQGSIEFENSTPNLYDISNTSENSGSVEDGWVNFEIDATETGPIYKILQINPSKRLKPNTDYWLVLEIKERSGYGGFNTNEQANTSQIVTSEYYQLPNLNAGDVVIRKIKTQEDFSQSTKLLRTTVAVEKGQKSNITFRWSLFEKEVTKDNFLYVPYGYKSITISIQKPFRAIGKNKDTFVFQNGKWYENHIIKRIENYNNEEINTEYVSNTGELSEGAVVDYVLDEPELIECTKEQVEILNQIQELNSYKGITHISSNDEISPVFEVEACMNIQKIINDMQKEINELKGLKTADEVQNDLDIQQ